MGRVLSVIKGEGDTPHGFYNSGGKYYARNTHKGKTKEYQLWENMKGRQIYAPLRDEVRYKNYSTVQVWGEWRDFQNFAKWFHEESNFVEGWQLDKDILSVSGGCSMYSPQTCTFIPEEMNKALPNRKNHRGAYPIGVSLCRGGVALFSRFHCKYPEYGTHKRFQLSEVNEAYLYYKVAKERYMKFLAEKWDGIVDPKVIKFFREYEVKIDD